MSEKDEKPLETNLVIDAFIPSGAGANDVERAAMQNAIAHLMNCAIYSTRVNESLRARLAAAEKERDETRAEAEQLRVQLAGCLTAADGVRQSVSEGDYGWSPAYQRIVDVRRECDELRERVSKGVLDAPREQVRKFALAMEARLRANDHKGGWEGEDPRVLLDSLEEEVSELRECLAVSGKPQRAPEIVLGEAADAANYAMMVADVCGALGE